VLICRATFSSPEERDDRTLHSVCLQAELAREAARESQRDAARCVTDDGLDFS